MRSNLFTLCLLVLLVACSSPKYTYHFDRHDYSIGKKQTRVELPAEAVEEKVQTLALDTETLVASADEKAIVLAEEENPVMASAEKTSLVEKYKAMSKDERKAFRKEIKKEIKKAVKEKKSENVEGTAVMDRDVKLAIIFGGIGVIFLLLPGNVFLVLGAISLIIGFVFFVMWLSRQ